MAIFVPAAAGAGCSAGAASSAFLASAEASTGDPNDPSTLAMAFDTRSATGLGVEGTASSSFFSSVRVSSFLSSSFFLPPNILPNRPTFLLASFIDACF